MTTKQSTAEYIVDQLSSLSDVGVRKMFGEYALYYKNKVVGLICNDTLFIKITAEGKSFVNTLYEEGFPYPGAKAWMRIDNDQLENHYWLCDLVSITELSLPGPKKKA